MQLQELLKNFKGNPPANPKEVELFRKSTSIQLPNDYLEFINHANGGEGFIGKNAYLILWKVGELVDLNAAYEVKTYAPGLLLIGSDGGGEAFAYDLESKDIPIISVPFVGMARDLGRRIAGSFNEFLENLHNS